MKISVIRTTELGETELDAWRTMQLQTPSLQNPFLAPEFTLAVGRARPKARVAVLEEGSKIVGFFPYEIRGGVIGKAIGAGISDCQGMVHAPGQDWDIKQLMRACRLPIWEFDHLIGTQEPFAPFHSRHEGSPVMDLSDGYESYLEARRAATGSSISSTLRKRRKLERDLGPLSFEFHDPDPAAMGQLMKWKSAQYHGKGTFDRFAQPWILQTVEDLLSSQSPGCSGTLSVLSAGGTPLAAHFGLRSESVLTVWFPTYGPEVGRYSPGMLLMLLLAEAAAERDIRYVDLGKGETRYKDALKNFELPLAVGTVVHSKAVGLVRRAELELASRVRAARARGSQAHQEQEQEAS